MGCWGTRKKTPTPHNPHFPKCASVLRLPSYRKGGAFHTCCPRPQILVKKRRRQQPARSVTDAGTFLAGGAAALLPGEGAAEARSRVFGHETPQHQASRIIQSCESWGGFLLQALGRCSSESFHTAAPKPKLLGRGVARRLLFLLHMPHAIRLCLCHTWISKSSSLT